MMSDNMEVREKLIKEAESVIKTLKEDKNVLAIILTGSAAWGDVTEKSDLDILAIVDDNKGVRYRYMLPSYCNIKRRTEIGCFPKVFVEEKIRKGHTDIISSRIIEQFRNGRILYEKNSVGTKIIEGCKKAKPPNTTIGNLIYKSKFYIKKSKEMLKNGSYAGAVLNARKSANATGRLLIFAKEHRFTPKHKHEYRYLKKYSKELDVYDKIHNIDGVDETTANDVVNNALNYVKLVFEETGIEPRFAGLWETIINP